MVGEKNTTCWKSWGLSLNVLKINHESGLCCSSSRPIQDQVELLFNCKMRQSKWKGPGSSPRLYLGTTTLLLAILFHHKPALLIFFINVLLEHCSVSSFVHIYFYLSFCSIFIGNIWSDKIRPIFILIMLHHNQAETYTFYYMIYNCL